MTTPTTTRLASLAGPVTASAGITIAAKTAAVASILKMKRATSGASVRNAAERENSNQMTDVDPADRIAAIRHRAESYAADLQRFGREGVESPDALIADLLAALLRVSQELKTVQQENADLKTDIAFKALVDYRGEPEDAPEPDLSPEQADQLRIDFEAFKAERARRLAMIEEHPKLVEALLRVSTDLEKCQEENGLARVAPTATASNPSLTADLLPGAVTAAERTEKA